MNNQATALSERDFSKQELPEKALSTIKRQLASVLGFSFFLNILLLTVPLYMLQVYDRVLTAGSVPTLIALSVVAVGLILMASLLDWIRSRLLVRLAGLMEQALEAPLLKQLLQSSGVVKREKLKDLERVTGFISGQGVLAVCDAPWIPVYLIVIAMLHPALGIVATIGALILAMVAFLSDRMTRGLMAEASARHQQSSRFAEQALDNVEVCRALGMGDGLVRHWLARRERGSVRHFRASDLGGNFQALGKFLRPLLQVAMLATGALLVLNQMMTAGAMVASSILLGRALAPLEMVIGQSGNIRQVRTAWTSINQFFSNLHNNIQAMSLPRPNGYLQIEKLVASVPDGEKPVIKGIGFALEAGESLAVVGPSASGKSTLARLLVGVWEPTSGAARLDGVDISRWNRAEVGQWLGYLPQGVELFPGTIKDNIARFGNVDSEAVVKAARLADMHSLILSLPDGYDTRVETEGGVHLSGGQRQRLGLARALYGQPSLVVLDEPDASLDQDGVQALMATVRKLHEQKVTLVMVTHRPQLLHCVDKVLVLNHGCIERFGDAKRAIKPAMREVTA
ncbi:type I secretion system permease/ATPase [Endozoicomonas sp. ALC013]|uniref:type I secretion system permease/ATPase n=1 Tax=Endozoicomonas sp. ALC013 TaxID=3403076 RepID=UPI003BB5264F